MNITTDNKQCQQTFCVLRVMLVMLRDHGLTLETYAVRSGAPPPLDNRVMSISPNTRHLMTKRSATAPRGRKKVGCQCMSIVCPVGAGGIAPLPHVHAWSHAGCIHDHHTTSGDEGQIEIPRGCT